MHRYDYVHTERGFQLWKRRAQFRRVGSELPGFLRHEAITLNQPLPLGELTHKRLWATLHIQPSWWGHLRNIVYKTPMVHLALEDTQGRRSTFRLTLPQVATGFILNPLLEDSVGYVCFAMGAANRQVRAMTLVVPEEDRKFFHDMARLELSELPSASDGTTCRELSMHMYFWMFPSAPTDYEAPFTPQEVQIDARLAVMLHAPSKLEFAELEGATSVSGAFGFVDTAYTGSGRTDGATFRILWQDSHRQVGLYERRLDPLNVPGDRGLQDFRIDLKGLSGGKLVLQIDPDATGNWDWTAWTGVKIE
jgi:hypothetical protein